VFPAGKDKKRRPYEDLRWSKFKNFAPGEMYTVVSEHALKRTTNVLFPEHATNRSLSSKS
jgi:hypothetical protein